MPALAWLETGTGKELGSASAQADAKQLLVCTYISAAVLLGLLANALLGWWWTDSVAALVVAGLEIREGIEAWRGDQCCAPSFGAHAHEHDHRADARPERSEESRDACC